MTNIQELLSKPVWQMTGEEFIMLSRHASGQPEACLLNMMNSSPVICQTGLDNNSWIFVIVQSN